LDVETLEWLWQNQNSIEDEASLTSATRTNGNSHSKVFPNQGEEAVHIFSGAPLLFYLLHCRHYLIPQCMYWLLYGFLRTATHITNTFFP